MHAMGLLHTFDKNNKFTFKHMKQILYSDELPI